MTIVQRTVQTCDACGKERDICNRAAGETTGWKAVGTVNQRHACPACINSLFEKEPGEPGSLVDAMRARGAIRD